MIYIVETIGRLIPFIGTTVYIAGMAMVFGLIFGTLICLMKLSRFRILKGVASIYITLVRATPTMVLLFLVYYGVPLVLQQIGLELLTGNHTGFAIAALSIYSSMTLAEIIRPAFQSIDKGQMEAGLMCGLTRGQTLRKIIVPQVVYVAFPNFGNMIIALIQESSLAFLIGVVDVMGKAKLISGGELKK